VPQLRFSYSDAGVPVPEVELWNRQKPGAGLEPVPEVEQVPGKFWNFRITVQLRCTFFFKHSGKEIIGE